MWLPSALIPREQPQHATSKPSNRGEKAAVIAKAGPALRKGTFDMSDREYKSDRFNSIRIGDTVVIRHNFRSGHHDVTGKRGYLHNQVCLRSNHIIVKPVHQLAVLAKTRVARVARSAPHLPCSCLPRSTLIKVLLPPFLAMYVEQKATVLETATWPNTWLSLKVVSSGETVKVRSSNIVPLNEWKLEKNFQETPLSQMKEAIVAAGAPERSAPIKSSRSNTAKPPAHGMGAVVPSNNKSTSAGGRRPKRKQPAAKQKIEILLADHHDTRLKRYGFVFESQNRNAPSGGKIKFVCPWSICKREHDTLADLTRHLNTAHSGFHPIDSEVPLCPQVNTVPPRIGIVRACYSCTDRCTMRLIRRLFCGASGCHG